MGDMFGISAGASALGQGTTAAAGAFYGNKLAREATGDAQNFAQYMSNTAYRRAVKDLRAAGLNPMLAYMNMSTSSPQVGAAQTFTPDFSNLISNAVSSGQQVGTYGERKAQLKEGTKQQRSQSKIQKNAEEESYHRVFSEMHRSALNEQEVLRSRAETALAQSQDLATQVQNRIRAYSIPSAKAVGEFDQTPAGQALLRAGRAYELGSGPIKDVGGAIGGYLRKGPRTTTINQQGYDAAGARAGSFSRTETRD